MSRFFRVFVGLFLGSFLAVGTNAITAKAPQIFIPPQEIFLRELKQKTEWSKEDVLTGIELLCWKYQFPYQELLKDLAWEESRLGEDERCGDGGLSCGLFQYRKETWSFFQTKYGRFDLNYQSKIDQIEMTILALRDGYWYLWGPLVRKFSSNPISSIPPIADQ